MTMRLPNGYGGVAKLSGNRRKPYVVRKTMGWHMDTEKDKLVQDILIIGYATTKAEALKMLADYNNNPYDLQAAKLTLKMYMINGLKKSLVQFQNLMY